MRTRGPHAQKPVAQGRPKAGVYSSVSPRLVWSFIFLLLIGLLGWGVHWFLEHYEQRQRLVRVDVSPWAKRNPLLAAERFLTRRGVESESISGREHLLDPPSGPGLLLVNRLGGSLPPERLDALLEWVAQGGHLVVTAEGEWDETAGSSGNSLLDLLGVEPIVRERPTDGETEPALRFRMPGSETRLEVAFSGERVLHDRKGHADWWLESDAGAHLLQYHRGDGKITVFGDHGFLTNEHIGEHDHALFLALLASDQQRAWLLYNSQMPSLLSLLWRHARALLITLACLLILLVWRLTRRSGPRLSGRQSERRNLMEHLTAAGQFIWRTDRARDTFKHSQAAIEQAWRKRYPVLETLEQGPRCTWIAERAGIAARAVEGALYGEYEAEADFIRLTTTQQRLAAQLRSRQ